MASELIFISHKVIEDYYFIFCTHLFVELGRQSTALINFQMPVSCKPVGCHCGQPSLRNWSEPQTPLAHIFILQGAAGAP